MFSSLGWAEMAVLLVLALFVFGPERLPGMAAEAGRGLRKARLYVKGMTDDLTSELGPEFRDMDLRSLNPKAFVAKHLLEGLDDDEEPARPARATSTESAAPARTRSAPDTPLGPDEPAPWDTDTT